MSRAKLFSLGALILLVVVWAGQPAWAGRLVIQVTAEAEAVDDLVTVRLKVANRGDEQATNVQAEALGQAESARSELISRLDPNETVALSLSYPFPDEGPGRYAAIVRVNFHDLNEYPFSALSKAYYVVGQDLASPLIVKADPVTISGRGRLKLRLLNPEEKALDVRASLFTPREMSIEPGEWKVKLPARGTEKRSFKLTNFSGLAGAEYPVMILLEYTSGGLHTAKVAEVKVKLTERGRFISRTLHWWLTAIGVLIVLFIIYQFWSRRRR